jgi:hypothetical protein
LTGLRFAKSLSSWRSLTITSAAVSPTAPKRQASEFFASSIVSSGRAVPVFERHSSPASANVKLNSILHKSLDIPAIKKIIAHDGKVYSRSDLHAKVYIFDNEKVVITSGNLTNNGLVKNFEYGVLIDEEEYVKQSVNDICNIMKDNEVTGFIGYKELLKIVSIYEGIKNIKLPNSPNIEDIILSGDKHISLNSYSVSKQLKGWNKAVFDIIDCFKNDQFILNDVYFHESYLKKVFPKNNHVKAKIRQTLQNLRDLGLIEFIDSGCYRRLWIVIEDKNSLDS